MLTAHGPWAAREGLYVGSSGRTVAAGYGEASPVPHVRSGDVGAGRGLLRSLGGRAAPRPALARPASASRRSGTPLPAPSATAPVRRPRTPAWPSRRCCPRGGPPCGRRRQGAGRLQGLQVEGRGWRRARRDGDPRRPGRALPAGPEVQAGRERRLGREDRGAVARARIGASRWSSWSSLSRPTQGARTTASGPGRRLSRAHRARRVDRERRRRPPLARPRVEGIFRRQAGALRRDPGACSAGSRRRKRGSCSPRRSRPESAPRPRFGRPSPGRAKAMALGFGVWPLFADSRFDGPVAAPFLRREDIEQDRPGGPMERGELARPPRRGPVRRPARPAAGGRVPRPRPFHGRFRPGTGCRGRGVPCGPLLARLGAGRPRPARRGRHAGAARVAHDPQRRRLGGVQVCPARRPHDRRRGPGVLRAFRDGASELLGRAPPPPRERVHGVDAQRLDGRRLRPLGLEGGSRAAASRRDYPSDCCISLVPTQLQRLLRAREAVAWLRRFRIVFVGGAPSGRGSSTRPLLWACPCRPATGPRRRPRWSRP